MYTLGMSTTYTTLLQDSYALGETKDCSVRALTVVSGRPYREVHEVFRKCGRRHRRGTPRHVTQKAIAALGLYALDVSKQYKGRTVRTLERELPAGKRFLVYTRRHMLGVRHGKVEDYTSGRLHRVEKIEEIVPRNPGAL